MKRYKFQNKEYCIQDQSLEVINQLKVEVGNKQKEIETLTMFLEDSQKQTRHYEAKFVEEIRQHRWIPVSERLPELIKEIPYPHSKDIWIIHRKYGAQKGYYSKREGWVLYGSYENKSTYQNQITHWKPIILPE